MHPKNFSNTGRNLVYLSTMKLFVNANEIKLNHARMWLPTYKHHKDLII